MKALVIDDEPKARNLLRTLLEERCPEVSAIVEATDLTSGIAQIRAERPDIVFLDIEMPGHLGTQIMEFLEPEEFNFSLVFVTAYNEHALKAFEINAVDYLLKPIRPKQLLATVSQITESRKQGQMSERLEALRLSLEKNAFQKVGLPMADGIFFVPIDELIHLEADGMYTKAYTTNNGSKTVSKPLKNFTGLVDKYPLFYRPHRSHMVNLKFLKEYIRKDGTYILLENDHLVPVSKEKRDELLAMVNLL